jgi:hypothetical protein
VNNLVFCRDPTVLRDKVACLNLKNLMHHENYLDIKALLREQDTADGGPPLTENRKKKPLKRQ